MVGTNSYLVVALCCLSGRCPVCSWALLLLQLLVPPCVRRAAASAVCCQSLRGPCCCVGLVQPVRAFVPADASYVCRLPASVLSCSRLPRCPTVRFLNLGRLYPGAGKRWTAPAPTLLWRCAVRPCVLVLGFGARRALAPRRPRLSFAVRCVLRPLASPPLGMAVCAYCWVLVSVRWAAVEIQLTCPARVRPCAAAGCARLLSTPLPSIRPPLRRRRSKPGVWGGA